MAVRIDEAGLKKLFPEIDWIEDDKLRQSVIDIWLEVAAECAWERFEDVPKSFGKEDYRGLVGHIRGVTQMAVALAETANELHGTPFDKDMLVAAGLLHDVSKPVECEPDPDRPESNGKVKPMRKSKLGANIQHAVYATHKIFAKGLPVELAHLVVTHTHKSNVRTPTFEGACLFYADYADSDANLIPVGGKSFAQRWELP